MVAYHMLDLFNKSVDGNFFPDEMKHGNVSALLKIVTRFTKNTVLASVSKAFERLLANQMLLLCTSFSHLKFVAIDRGKIPSLLC